VLDKCEDEHNRRVVLDRLLRYPHPENINRFLDLLGNDFAYMDLRDCLTPGIVRIFSTTKRLMFGKSSVSISITKSQRP